jgi:steroid delta-isomerase-like uncharacterized protein
MPEGKGEFVRRWFEEVWNQKRASAIDEMFDAKGKSRGFPDPDSVLEGPEAFRKVHEQFCGAFPDLRLTIEDVVSEGDRVAVRWRADGTLQGDHLGFPATGRKASMTGSSFITVRDGKIVDGWNQMDMQGFFQRLRQEP